MRDTKPQFWLKTGLFSIDPSEDEETNPFMYGRQLANWLQARFVDVGYDDAEIIPEDWAWCVMRRWDPFMLWIGCVNVIDSDLHERVPQEQKSSYLPDPEKLIWTCTVGTDSPVWTSFFWKKLLGTVSTDDAVGVVSRQLQQILSNEKAIVLVSAKDA